MAKRYQNREWKKSMTLRLDYNNMMSEFVGEKEGFSIKTLNASRSQALKAFERVQESRGKGWLGWMDLPYNQTEIVADINATAKQIRKTAKKIVIDFNLLYFSFKPLFPFTISYSLFSILEI